MALSKRFALFTLICTVCALVIAPTVGAVTYPVPKPKGGTQTTKGPTKKIGTKLQHTTVHNLAVNGLKLTVHFPSAGKISCTVKHNGTTIGSGHTTAKGKVSKTLGVTFNSVGKAFLKHGAGQKVTVSCTFQPKVGPRSTSSVTVRLG